MGALKSQQAEEIRPVVTSGWKRAACSHSPAQYSEAPTAPKQREQEQPPQGQAPEGTERATADPWPGCAGDAPHALPKSAAGLGGRVTTQRC